MFTKIKFLLPALVLLAFVGMALAEAPTDRITNASYLISGEVHLKSTDTLAKTGDTIKFLTPATKLLTGVNWTLMTGKVTPLTGVTDSIGMILKLICYDDSSHELQSAVLDTITDSLSEPIAINYIKYPATRYAIFGLSSAATFSGGVKLVRAKMVYGYPVNK